MFIAYCVIAVLYAVMLTFSGILKLQLNPQIVQTIHEVIGVPLSMFPALVAGQFAGAAGLVAGSVGNLLASRPQSASSSTSSARS